VLNRLFGVTLWCKTLVLRKDKVTQCVNVGLTRAGRAGEISRAFEEMHPRERSTFEGGTNSAGDQSQSTRRWGLQRFCSIQVRQLLHFRACSCPCFLGFICPCHFRQNAKQFPHCQKL